MYINKERLTVAITMAILIAVVIAAGAWWDPADARGVDHADADILFKVLCYILNSVAVAFVGVLIFMVAGMIIVGGCELFKWITTSENGAIAEEVDGHDHGDDIVKSTMPEAEEAEEVEEIPRETLLDFS